MNRDQILQQASEMFYTVGFKTLTMDDIANELAISKKTLYEHFGSKEKLIAEVLTLGFEDVQDFFAKIQGDHLNAIEELIVLKQYVNKKFYTIQRQNCLFQLQRYYAKLYRKIFIAQHHKILEQLHRNFVKGREQGLYRKEIDPDLTSRLFLNTQNSIKSQTNFYEDLENQFLMAQIHADIFIRGILSVEGLEKYERLIKTE